MFCFNVVLSWCLNVVLALLLVLPVVHCSGAAAVVHCSASGALVWTASDAALFSCVKAVPARSRRFAWQADAKKAQCHQLDLVDSAGDGDLQLPAQSFWSPGRYIAVVFT